MLFCRGGPKNLQLEKTLSRDRLLDESRFLNFPGVLKRGQYTVADLLRVDPSETAGQSFAVFGVANSPPNKRLTDRRASITNSSTARE